MTDTLHIATYNIHKGLSFFKRRLVIHEVREHLRLLNADLVFLQEVQGNHAHQARRFLNWPEQSQYEFIADSVWTDFAYGRNAVYDSGHHGNAILSRFPIGKWENEDISEHRFESRGLLHCEIKVPGWDTDLHCVCVHLGLTRLHRSRQMRALRERIDRMVPPQAPLIVAGDFNDWARHANNELARPLGLHEVFEHTFGRPARSFPAMLPLFHLDRIYVRGFSIKQARVHQGSAWAKVSDHAALTSTIVRL
ncbi:MAG: Endonuclease/exonuclease/phosphatase [Betaproteobacteria bacterium]|nr:Endonuclease/exonuclease/phosphatase [Betaproteobacteria bacterium]